MTDLYDRMRRELTACRRVLLTTHVRPDGDALGTVAALTLGLRALGVPSHALLLSKLPSKYAFVLRDNGIEHTAVEGDWPASLDLGEFDALLVCDTGTWSQLPGLRERLEGWRGRRFVVDHHLTQEDWADLRLVVTDAAAAGEIAAELLQAWGVALTPPIATALFVAIVSDTGWFQFSNTRPYTLRLAAMLIEAGVDTDRLYQRLYQNERAERVALQTRAMNSLRLVGEGRIALMRISAEDFSRTGANVPDTENLINVPLQIASVEVSALLVEPPDGGAIRVSLRSKGSLDCARFAEAFGGGGHARAAGMKLEASLAEAAERVEQALRSA